MPDRRGESERHLELKRRALVWAQAGGFPVCGVEVRVPRSGFRADVVGCALPRNPSEAGEVAVFECKQARSDLLRDTADEKRTGERLREVAARRAELERLLGLHLPHLRRGESLFAECDQYDLDSVRHDGLRAVRREEAELQAKLHGGTKFDRLRRYRAADRCYLVVCEGLMMPHEVPPGWGLLEAAGDGLILRRRPERLETSPEARLAMLRAVAITGTRRLNLQLGIPWEEIERRRQMTVPEASGE